MILRCRPSFEAITQSYPQSDAAPGAYYYLGWLTMIEATTQEQRDDDISESGPGENVVFELLINLGSGTFTMADFEDLSQDTSATGNILSLAAAKFVNGPGDDSAFGNAIPEPGTAVLMALGLLGLVAVGRSQAH